MMHTQFDGHRTLGCGLDMDIYTYNKFHYCSIMVHSRIMLYSSDTGFFQLHGPKDNSVQAPGWCIVRSLSHSRLLSPDGQKSTPSAHLLMHAAQLDSASACSFFISNFETAYAPINIALHATVPRTLLVNRCCVALAAGDIANTDRTPRTWDCNSRLGCPFTKVFNSMTSLFTPLSKWLNSLHLQPVLTESLRYALEFLQLVVHQRRSPRRFSNCLCNYRRRLASLQAKGSLSPLRNQWGHLFSRKTPHDPKGSWPWSLGQYYYDDDSFLIPVINSRQRGWAFVCLRSTSVSGPKKLQISIPLSPTTAWSER